jgi:hypothetical protein
MWYNNKVTQMQIVFHKLEYYKENCSLQKENYQDEVKLKMKRHDSTFTMRIR